MEIIPGIHVIEGVYAHCYLIHGNELILIDTGMPGNTKRILRYITNTLQRAPSDLKTILLTHCDIDHIGNALKLRAITGAKIAAHPHDAEVIAGKKTREIQKNGMRLLFKLLHSFMRIKPFQVDIQINDADRISGLTVLHMPGHTQGSVAFYDQNRKVLFIGDTLRCSAGIVHGPPKSITMSLQLAYQSIQKLYNLDFTVLLDGHGEPITSDASAKVREFIAKIKNNKTT